MLKAKSRENFVQNFDKFSHFRRSEGQGYKNFRLLLQKVHPWEKPRHSIHFTSKLVGGSDLQVDYWKDVIKSQRLP